ncbi:glutamine synthetase III family protein [Oscillospiraceae bacterium LTW-04]|nr:glutamine synthetase III [Oscillospiraceae bacterium MB24-C1]
MTNVPEIFGSMVFSDGVMQNKLPKACYKEFHKLIKEGKPLTLDLANVIANAMMDWAVEKGVTHFTHWFQPMTGITAEKHDSFITPLKHGKVIMDFSGKELIRGEPDASSFPSGGLRATFEARGYTAWDPTSPAFIKDGTLCIPTAFCSYGGEALDKKTPLMRSLEAFNVQALRILRLFNTPASRVTSTVGAEQEYFLVNKDMFQKRRDLVFTGRTLFGAKAPKGQEMDDHYFGAIDPSVSAFMKDLDEELWKLGILAKTEHKEVAPAQYELAPIFSTTNIATDHNQLTMEMLKKVALRHNMVCLLHEKPFAGVNGSGKHNNWSIATDTGINLLEPGDSPEENAQFLLFLVAVIKAVDDYQDLLRISVASAGNDHRLGANEAPPAILSIFLGDQLTGILGAIANGTAYNGSIPEDMTIGVNVLPRFHKDLTDRNRTSPFAFTGNKFEFRMPGSSFSISGPNVVLNSIVAEELCQFADKLEAAEDFTATLNKLIKKTVKEHQRIIFNGDGYSEDWQKEAARRGLLNLKSTPEVIPHFVAEKNVKMFEKHGVFSAAEMHSRCDILLENYCKTLDIEAYTMLDMARKNILPAVLKYTRKIAEGAVAKKAFLPEVSCKTEEALVTKLSLHTASLINTIDELESLLLKTKDFSNLRECARFHHDSLFAKMQELRAAADALELMVDESEWPFPSYGQLLFSL